MAQLPSRFTSRMKLSDIKASALNAGLDMLKRHDSELKALRGLVSGRVHRDPPREKTVVIVSLDGPTITVQRVIYATIPPQECTGSASETVCQYELTGDIFDAFPDFGWRVNDYRDDVFENASGDETPDEATTFLRVYMEESTWRLQRPKAGSGGEFALAIPIGGVDFTDDSKTFMVQLVKSADGVTFVSDGDAIEVFVWPNTRGKHYRQMIESPSPPVIRIERHGGNWYARQMWPWATGAPDPTREAGDCPPVT